MMGGDIDLLLRCFPRFGGVVTPDKKHLCKKGYVYILNSEPFPGRHWLCLDLRNPQAEFFDSFGHTMERYRFQDLSTPIVTYSAQQLQQDDSDVCGAYCVMYAAYKLRGRSIKDFLRHFSHDKAANDAFILRWLAKYTGRTNTHKKKK